jgi:transcription-repair coupling factor (superfamily II helicase)
MSSAETAITRNDDTPSLNDGGATSRVPTIYGAPFGHLAFALSEAAIQVQRDKGQKAIALHVCTDEANANELAALIGFFNRDIETLIFPAWDCLPYDRVSPKTDVMGVRMAALSKLLAREKASTAKPLVVLTTVNAFSQKCPPRSALADISMTLQKGGRLEQETLVNYLAQNGYERTDTVREAGEFAVRGGIVDLYPAEMDSPVRVDFFGDEIDTLRYFDSATQRSGDAAKSVSLSQAGEIILNEARIQNFRTAYRELFGGGVAGEPLYEAISEGRRYDGMEHWLPLFYSEEGLESLLDYCGGEDNCALSFDYQAVQSRIERIAQIEDFYASRKTLEKAAAEQRKKSIAAKRSASMKQKLGEAGGSDVALTGGLYRPVPADMMFDMEADSLPRESVQFSPFSAPRESDIDLGARPARDFKDLRAQQDVNLFEEIKRYFQAQQLDSPRKSLIACYSDGARERIKSMLANAGLEGLRICDTPEHIKKLGKGEIGLVVLPIERGIINDKYTILSEQDILGDRMVRANAKKRKSKSDVFIREVTSLNEGDLVVHEEHGIGRFIGLETLDIAGAKHDCVKIIYGGEDKLYIPVENIEVLSRYGQDEGTAQLDKLGGAGWQARKSKIKKDLLEMAGKLIDIAAARKLRKAQRAVVPESVYNEFAARFPYPETEDQQRSIHDVLEDMASETPMDRLVCGDVGFGKTEVALRAAFVAGMSGFQVAVVAPTTLLVRQHYSEFVRRFEGFGLRIEQLSRLVTPKEAKQTKEGLTNGDVNIVVGTHAVLAESIKFNNLGLVIIDEEQKFGVKQKERLKDLRKDVHVLTLTATPIPRTLQMALTGVRELSLITTPPVDRLAIRNFVMPFDPMVIREAILREHHRGGQSFCVCPRIKDLKKVEDKLKELVPEIRIISAHGQLSPAELEDRMRAFYDREYDMLLATNIIESGIDVPSANTLIVYRADLFGLAQLYQIRGRVGRSKQRAYAYLTYLPDQILSQDAQKRLEVIDMLDTLGGGFQLASHDMDIRGAGNLVGEQQSGHVKEVGVELYQQMLEEAVAQAKAGVTNDNAEGAATEHFTPEIALGMAVLIPESYIKDLNVRMSLYRRLADLIDIDDIEGFAAEMIDRFGSIPQEVENLLEIMKLKALCRTAGVSKIDAGPKGIVVSFHKDTPPNPEGVIQIIAGSMGTIKLRHDQKMVYTRNWTSDRQRLDGVKRILSDLIKAANLNN